MNTARPTSELPTAAEFLESVLLVPIGFVLSVTVFPGFLLCVPGLCLLALMIAVPLVALALVVVAAGLVLTVAVAILALPRVLFQAIRAHHDGARAAESTQPVGPAKSIGLVTSTRARPAVASGASGAAVRPLLGLEAPSRQPRFDRVADSGTAELRPRKALT
jgi:hypothetical protein